ncbi:hypothetical protein AX14_007721, partial [Amanita brunnescens Koide BX004]
LTDSLCGTHPLALVSSSTSDAWSESITLPCHGLQVRSAPHQSAPVGSLPESHRSGSSLTSAFAAFRHDSQHWTTTTLCTQAEVNDGSTLGSGLRGLDCNHATCLLITHSTTLRLTVYESSSSLFTLPPAQATESVTPSPTASPLMLICPRRAHPSSTRGSAISRHPSRHFTRLAGPFSTPTAPTGIRQQEEHSLSPATMMAHGKTSSIGALQAPLSMRKSSLSKLQSNGLAFKSSSTPFYSSTIKPRCHLSSIPGYGAVKWCASASVKYSRTIFPPATTFSLHYCPSHSGIEGNERADQLTKLSAAIAPVNPPRILLSNFVNNFTKHMTVHWQTLFASRSFKGHHWLPICRKKKIFKLAIKNKAATNFFHLLSANDISTLSHMAHAITNHTPVSEYHTHFYPDLDPYCPACPQCLQTRTHVLFHCSRYIPLHSSITNWSHDKENSKSWKDFFSCNTSAFTFGDLPDDVH